MNKGNKSKLNMFTVLVLYFTKYITLFSDYGQLVLEIAGFKVVVSDLGIDVGIQTKDIKGITASKNEQVVAAI